MVLRDSAWLLAAGCDVVFQKATLMDKSSLQETDFTAHG
jgi:hypothetical protein